MKTETKNKEHRWKDSISSLPTSSRSSSILSDSSDGHFEIRNFPLPKPSLSAAEAQKQRESHQAYNNSSKLVDLPGYDPNRIPLSIFSSKPGKDWSITSNESLFSIHDEKFSALLASALRLDETNYERTEIKKPNESEKETIGEEKSDSEIDENEEDMFELESDNEEEEEEEEEGISEEESLIEIETEISEEKQEAGVMKEKKQEDSNSMVSHSHATSCLTDVSNNSTASFTLPELQKEDGVIKTPSMLIKRNVLNQLTQRSIILRNPQHKPYAKSSTLTKVQSRSKPQKKASKKHLESQLLSPKDKRNGWFSCFHCPSMSGLFK